MSENGNKSAFAHDNLGEGFSMIPRSRGLTKREYFAAMAMHALMTTDKSHSEVTATNAILYADALLLELEKRK